MSYQWLLGFQRKGMRNGNWARLTYLERALYKGAMWLAKIRGRIVNMELVMQMARIIIKIIRTARTTIYSLGRARAAELNKRFEEAELFRWAPWVREWFTDREYVFYLGVTELNTQRGW